MKSIICALAAVLLLGCGPECEPDETRCNGNVVEICDGDGIWCEVMNCDELNATYEDIEWRCCTVDVEEWAMEDLHTCRPIEDCRE